MDILLVLVLLCALSQGLASQAPPCEDLSTAACTLFHSNKPDLCSDQALSSTCQRFCGQCPLVCYDCPVGVNSSADCNDTKACGHDEVCMRKEHTIPDGTKEYIMSCEKKETCEGMSFGFHTAIGKRDLSFHCCSTDNCNYPPEFITTTLPTTVPTTTVTTQPTTTLKPLNNCSRDVVFVLDGSTSIGSSNHNYMRGFVQQFVRHLRIGPSDSLVSVVEYSDTARVEWYLTDHMNVGDLATASRNIPYVSGTTATHAAFYLVRSTVLTARHGDRANAKDVVIVLTDGGTDIPDMAISEAKRLHDNGVEIVMIGIGNNVDEHELRDIIQSTGEYFKVGTYSSLQYITTAVAQILCK